ncbi:MAG: hypothetical protein ACK2T3_01340 [Candidatus Promineifilaceae bacterium]|jgi:hypothetical protein
MRQSILVLSTAAPILVLLGRRHRTAWILTFVYTALVAAWLWTADARRIERSSKAGPPGIDIRAAYRW